MRTTGRMQEVAQRRSRCRGRMGYSKSKQFR